MGSFAQYASDPFKAAPLFFKFAVFDRCALVYQMYTVHIKRLSLTYGGWFGYRNLPETVVS